MLLAGLFKRIAGGIGEFDKFHVVHTDLVQTRAVIDFPLIVGLVERNGALNTFCDMTKCDQIELMRVERGIVENLGVVMPLDGSHDVIRYPMGKSGSAIPLAARIVFAVEWFDEYLQANQGKPDFSLEQAVRVLRAQANLLVDPVVAEAVARCAPLFSSFTEAVTDLDQNSALDLPTTLKTMWRWFVA